MLVKIKVLKKVGKSVVDIGVQEIENIEFARQLIDKGLAVLVEGEIPAKEVKVKEPKLIIEVKEDIKVEVEEKPKKKKKRKG